MTKLLAAVTAAAACAIVTAAPVLANDDDPHGRAGLDSSPGATASTAPATSLPWGIGHAAATAMHGVDPDRLDASLMRLYAMGRGSRVTI